MVYRRLFRFPFPRRTRVAREVEDELHFHLEMRIEEYVARGMPEEEARREAFRRFGNLESARRRLTDESLRRERRFRRGVVVDDLWRDVRYGLRGLRRNPGFAATAALTLSLGIGATTAIFSVAHAVLLAPLPYPQPERLLRLYDSGPRFDGRRVNVNPMNLLDWRAANRGFEDLGGWYRDRVGVRGPETAELVQAGFATVGFFGTLGTRPILGRNFAPEEYEPGGTPVVMLAHDYWRRRYGSEPSVLGSTIDVDGEPHVVVGVQSPNTLLPGVSMIDQPRLWLPARIGPHNGRGGHWLRAMGRLRSGVDLAAIEEEMSLIARRLEEAYPDSNTGVAIAIEPLHESVVGDARRAVMLLALAALLILLIAGVNVANLQLARATSRRTELGVRAALGAGRPRLVRQIVVENLCLAALGGIAGIALAYLLVQLLRPLAGTELPRLDQVSVTRQALALASVISLLCGLLISVAPAARGLGGRLQATLRQGARALTPGAASQRLGNLLAIVQVALAAVLLSGSGLLLTSLVRLSAVDPGFDTKNLIALRVVLPQAEYREGRERVAFVDELLEGTRRLPGVLAAGAVDSPPFQFEQRSRSSFQPEDRPPPPPDQRPSAYEQYITPGYLETLDLNPRGRDVTPTDGSDAPGVILVNEALAELIWPGEDAVGKRLRYNGSREVIGVVPSTRRTGLDVTPEPEMYLPYAQWSYGEAMFVVARVAGSPAPVIASFRSLLASMDPGVPMGTVATMEQLVSKTLAAPRSRALLFGLFAAVAVVLALLGIYGVLSYTVSRRTHEFGVRLALGARTWEVIRLVMRRGLGLTLAGLLVGAIGSFWLARMLETFLYEVSPTDPLTAGAVAVLFLASAAFACWVPARRATRADAILSLRTE